MLLYRLEACLLLRRRDLNVSGIQLHVLLLMLWPINRLLSLPSVHPCATVVNRKLSPRAKILCEQVWRQIFIEAIFICVRKECPRDQEGAVS